MNNIYNNDKNNDIKKYILPDDTEIGNERFLAPEILFNPLLKEYEYSGLHEIISNSINKTNINLKKNLYNFVLLSGGNMKMKGIKERLHKELKN